MSKKKKLIAKESLRFKSAEELVKSLEEYSGFSIEPEDVDTRQKLLDKISEIQDSLSNEVTDNCSRYYYEAGLLSPDEEMKNKRIISQWKLEIIFSVSTVILLGFAGFLFNNYIDPSRNVIGLSVANGYIIGTLFLKDVKVSAVKQAFYILAAIQTITFIWINSK